MQQVRAEQTTNNFGDINNVLEVSALDFLRDSIHTTAWKTAV
jgi:hypothetical protein